MKKSKIIKCIIILILILIVILFLLKTKKLKSYDDFLFLKLISNTHINKDKYKDNEFEFNVNYASTKLMPINLIKTVDKNTLINEKIAPGTKGDFYIILKSNEKTRYKVSFFNENEKPKNLKFDIYIDNKPLLKQIEDLEKISNKLEGIIEKNQTIKVRVSWYWGFGKTESDDKVDTKDSQNIGEYKFSICAQGEKFI